MDSRAIALAKRPELMNVAALMYKANMRRYVKDPELRRKLTPKYKPGCKRILISDNFYQAVADPKIELITDGIERITADGIVTVDGTEHKVDAIVCATGFHVTDWYTYLEIKGAGGEDLGDRWNREGVMAHRGITVADVPNLFLLLGPNTGLGHNSVVFMIESQIGYVADAISRRRSSWARRRWRQLAPRRTGSTRSCRRICRPPCGTRVVARAGISTSTASTASLWSGFTWEYWLATRKFKMAEYRFSGVGQLTPDASPGFRATRQHKMLCCREDVVPQG